MSLDLDKKIESLLFYKGEPVSIAEICKYFNVGEAGVLEAVNRLRSDLEGRGIRLLINEKELMLGTHEEMSSFFEDLRKEELNKELSRASLETLSVILYKDKVSRAEIDYIRGVNSTYILRNLSVRGLIEKVPDPKDSRVFVYTPSLELLSFLGVSSVKDLPDYENIFKALESKIIDQKSNEIS